MRERKYTPLRAIRRNCLDCSGGPTEVRLCTVDDCPLYAFRFGTQPSRKGIGGRGRDRDAEGGESHSGPRDAAGSRLPAAHDSLQGSET